MSDEQDLQTTYLNRLRREGQRVAIWLVSGKRLVGRVKGHDRFTVLLDMGGTEQLIFKHAIASLSPSRDTFRERESPAPS